MKEMKESSLKEDKGPFLREEDFLQDSLCVSVNEKSTLCEKAPQRTMSEYWAPSLADSTAESILQKVDGLNKLFTIAMTVFFSNIVATACSFFLVMMVEIEQEFDFVTNENLAFGFFFMCLAFSVASVALLYTLFRRQISDFRSTVSMIR